MTEAVPVEAAPIDPVKAIDQFLAVFTGPSIAIRGESGVVQTTLTRADLVSAADELQQLRADVEAYQRRNADGVLNTVAVYAETLGSLGKTVKLPAETVAAELEAILRDGELQRHDPAIVQAVEDYLKSHDVTPNEKFIAELLDAIAAAIPDHDEFDDEIEENE